MPRGMGREARGRLVPLPGFVLVVAGVLLGAGLTVWLPIVTVVVSLAAVDLALLIYWLYSRPRAADVSAGSRAPLRGLARVLSAAGVVLIVNALLLTMLGVFTEMGITNERTANWSGLAAIGMQVSVDHPSAFGARCLIVSAAVWAVGFGLTKASGEKA